MAGYAELNISTNFSFLHGASHPEEFVEQAAQLGYRTISIADRNSFAGIVRAHSAAKKCGIRLAIGTRLTLHEEPGDEGLYQEELPYHLILYPRSRVGYEHLCQLLTNGKRRAPKALCYLSLRDLAEFSSDLLAIVVPQSLNDPRLVPSMNALWEYFSPETLSLSVARTYASNDDHIFTATRAVSQQTGITMLATNDVCFHHPKRKPLQDVLCCIREGVTLQQAGLRLQANSERFLKHPKEMLRLFRRAPQCIERAEQIAEQASQFSLDEIVYEYPAEISPEHTSPDARLTTLTWIGAHERYPDGIPKTVLKQLEHELELIKDLRYAKYFLTVHDIVSFARSQQILCQGRGAAANSAVCYVLGITAVNPAEIHLLVERFISRERNEPPDIDIDFEHERREEVIQYIYQKFGRHRAALVAEVIRYRTRSAVRDVAKTFDIPPEQIDNMVRLMTRHKDQVMTPALFQQYSLPVDDHRLMLAITVASELRGFPRHLSQHVGGFVISDGPLSRIVPIENAAMADRTVMEWDKDDIDVLGMLKIDVLALGMLTALRKSMSLLNALPSRQHLPALQLHTVPADDTPTYDMICRADTIGTFQIESRAQQAMLPRLRPRCFYDLVVEIAIVRPGPIQGGMVHPYLRRRNGEEPVVYPDARVRAVLERTLGVPIFQEQVMELAIVAAGYTPGEADELRRAMGSWKKKENALVEHSSRLIRGMRLRNYSEDFAHRLVNQIHGFGEYGFPQSHSASFALIAYVSCWLKCHHPAAFTAALLNSQPMGFYQPAQLLDCAQRHGVEVLQVDILKSSWDCTLEETPSDPSPSIRLGFRMIKSLGQHEIIALVTHIKTLTRASSLKEIWRGSGVRVSTLKKLAQADALRSLGLDRQSALWELGKFRDRPLPLFDAQESQEPTIALPRLAPIVKVLQDYDVTGLSLRGHPMAFLRLRLAKCGAITNADLRDEHRCPPGSRVAIAGIVLVRQRPSTASGVVFLTLEDESAMANLIVRSSVFEAYEDIARDSSILLVVGRVQRQREVLHLLAEELIDISSWLHGSAFESRDFH